MINRRALRHVVFWPGLVLEVLAQVISIPAVWFLVTQPGFFRFEWLRHLPPSVSVSQIVAVFALWFLACGKFITVFGYYFDRRQLMQFYSVFQLLYLAIGMNVTIGPESLDWFAPLTLVCLAHILLAIHVGFKDYNMNSHAV